MEEKGVLEEGGINLIGKVTGSRGKKFIVRVTP